jgi:hypothetical protein
MLKPFVRIGGIGDPFGTLRLVRISVVRDAIRDAGQGVPLASAAGWGANAELLMRLARASRRVETVEVTPRYDLRQRPSRVQPWSGALDLWRFGMASRGLPPVAAATAQPAEPREPRQPKPEPRTATSPT